MVVHACNPSTWELRQKNVLSQPRKLIKILFQKRVGRGHTSYSSARKSSRHEFSSQAHVRKAGVVAVLAIQCVEAEKDRLQRFPGQQ